MTKTIDRPDLRTRPLLRFWTGWVRGHLGAIALATLLLTLVAVSSSAYPVLVGQIIDALAVLGAGGTTMDGPLTPAQWAWMGPVLIVVATLVKSVTLYAATVVTNKVALASTTRLQKDLFNRLTTLDYVRLTGEPAASFTARFLNDVHAIRESVWAVATGFVRDLLILIGVVAVMLWSDWQLALVCLVLMPVAIGPIASIGRRIRKTAERAYAQAGELSGVIEESLSGTRLVKTYGLEASETARVGAALDRRMALLLKIAEQRGRASPILEFVGGLAVAGVFAFAALRIEQGASSVGDLMSFVTSLLLAAQSVRNLGNLNTLLQEGKAGLERFFSVLDERPGVADRPDARDLPPGPGRVRFDDVSFSWGAGAGVKQVSFEAVPGQTIALVGPSGGGKTTILNLLARLIDVESGSVLVDGADVRDVTLASLRSRIALVSQDATLFDASIAENVAQGRPGAERAEILAALEAAACDFVQRLDGGIDALVGPRGSRLSGGERQRLSLARAILRNAPILLLDEPTSALDAESESRVQEALDRFSANRTTIVVAHRLATVRRADKILVLRAGRVEERGTHEELVAAGGLYAHLASRQFQD